MPYLTDERLKSYLDTNQLHREQMCLAILATDKRFSDVRPRHPRGGPDGGRDIEAIYRNKQKVFAAVGFINQANDSDEQKKRIRDKFKGDLQSALSETPAPDVFVFLTNINLTIGEKDELIYQAKTAGLIYCEIIDRERLRIFLDSPDGYAMRFQFLGLPLSESEQASFFAKWGDDIQSVISTGFQKIEQTLNRLLFLQESWNVMSSLEFLFELDRNYSADEIGHFRAFCYMHLKGPKHRIFGILFGRSDKSYRMRNDLNEDFSSQMPGIKYGMSGGQWEQHIEVNVKDENKAIGKLLFGEEEILPYKLTRSSSSIGMSSIDCITIEYNHDKLIRFSPKLALRDIDEASFLPLLNKSLAEKIKGIHIYSNGYKLQEISQCNFKIDMESFDPKVPVNFSKVELSDVWVRIRPVRGCVFKISFANQTPTRMFSSTQAPDSIPMTGAISIY